MLKEKIIICKDCGNPFVFSVSEQEYFANKGFPNEPVRCPESPCDPLRATPQVIHDSLCQKR